MSVLTDDEVRGIRERLGQDATPDEVLQLLDEIEPLRGHLDSARYQMTMMQREIDRLRGTLHVVFKDPYHTPHDVSEHCLFCGAYTCYDDCAGKALIAEFGPQRAPVTSNSGSATASRT